jgi:ribonuclease R
VHVRARFRPNPRGFGFLHLVAADGLTPTEVTVDRTDGPAVTADSVFVPPPLAKGIIADDLVDAEVAADDKGLTATSITIVERPRRMLVGTVQQGPGRLVLDPNGGIGSGWIRLDESMTGPLTGALGRVIVVLRAEDGDGAPLGRALVAGPYIAGSPQAVRAISAVVALGRAAPELVPGGAAAAGLEPSAAAMTHTRVVGLLAGGGRGAAGGLDVSGRIPGAELGPFDRRDEPCVTIDSAETRDLDDAVAATWSDDPTAPVQVAIHIADVAGTVGMDSDADLYARTVASTAYLAVGANAPMLDPALSEGSLSLLPSEYRHVISVRFAVSAEGHISDVDVETALIESRARLTYGAVEKWLDGDHGPVETETGQHADIATAVLDAALEASRRLGVERDARVTFEELFADAEVTPALVDGRLNAVAAEPDARGYRLIERLMVAANEAVASYLVANDVPALYRAHQGLDPGRLERLVAAVELAGASVPALDDPDSEADVVSAQLLAEIDRLGAEGRVADRALLVAVATGSTARATYDPDPKHHRGLASGAYTHFTSPIRRYADLVVHRQLRAAVAGEALPYSSEDLAALAGWLDARSGAMNFLQARERGDLWAILLDRGFLSAPEPATVTGVTVNGLKIRIPRLGIGAFVTAERALGLPDRERGQLQVDEHGLDTTSGPWRVGSQVMVRFVGLDTTGRTTWRLGDPSRA